MVYPFKSRVASLEVGDIFSLSESERPAFIVLRQDAYYTYYRNASYGSDTESIAIHSQRIILKLGKTQPTIKNVRYRYINTETGDKYKNLDEASKGVGFHPCTISISLNRRKNRKIPIEKIRPY